MKKKNNDLQLNLIFERHGTSSANVINKSLGVESKFLTIFGQSRQSKYAPDSSLSTIGVLQSLQTAEYITNHYDLLFDKNFITIFYNHLTRVSPCYYYRSNAAKNIDLSSK